MFLQPLLHIGMLVRGIVVDDQMQRFILGCFAVNFLQKLQPFDVAMPLLALVILCLRKEMFRSTEEFIARALLKACRMGKEQRLI